MCSSRPPIADATLHRLDPLIWELASVDDFEAQPSRIGAELTRAHKVSSLRPFRPLRLRACRASPPSLHSHAAHPLNLWSLCPVTSLKLIRVRISSWSVTVTTHRGHAQGRFLGLCFIAVDG